MTTFTVTNTNDDGPGSLRQAILNANDPVANPGADEIEFDPSLEGETITLSSGELVITDDLSIDGDLDDDGTPDITVDANQLSRVINVGDGNETVDKTVVLKGLTITNGKAATGGGGGILNEEEILLYSSIVSDSKLPSGSIGSGINNVGSLTINNSAISGNSFVEDSYGDSYGDGGGINNSGNLSVNNSTISSNSTGFLYGASGGGISNTGNLEVNNSTISGNDSFYGDGIANNGNGNASVSNSTILKAGDDGSGDGIFHIGEAFTLANSITDSARGLPITSNGVNLVTDGSVSGALTLDPMLGPLQNNGGTTETHALLSGSPAIELGDDGFIPADEADLDGDGDTTEPVPFDQRGPGFNRIANSSVDLGAYEFQGDAAASVTQPGLFPVLTVDTLVDENDFDLSPGDVSLREAIAFVEDGGTVNFDSALAGGTIELESTLSVDKSIDIQGLGADLLTVDGNGRVFLIDDGDDSTTQTVTLQGLTITGGFVSSYIAFTPGGGISNRENLTVTGSVITGNNAIFDSGGGIANYEEGILTVANSTISDNDADYNGGGIYNLGDLTISNSTISGNEADLGGGGGLSNRAGSATISNSTISRNPDDIYEYDDVSSDAPTIIQSSIVGSVSGSDISASDSLIENGSIDVDLGGNILGQSANLDPAGLQNNGGPTPTIALQADSPAIDAGSNPNSLAFDQRGEGFPREVNGQADIGAFEVQPSPDVLEFHLIDAGTDTVIATIEDGDVFEVGTLPDLNDLTVAAKVPNSSPLASQVESAFINLNGGEATRTENGEPYTLYGDINGNFFTGNGLPLGDNSISFALFSEDRRQGDLLDTVVLNFSIVDAPTSLVVNTLVDELDGSVTDGDISLRDAIAAIAEGGTITFDESLAGGAINLSLGELAIEKSLTINGDVDSDLRPDITLDANQQTRVINISDSDENDDKVVSLNGLTVTGGASDGDGGGILNFENLTVTNSAVSRNEAAGNGGGISNNDGNATVKNTKIRHNKAGSAGGGVYNYGSSFERELTLTDSTVSKNESGTVGGGLANNGWATIGGSTFSGNNSAVNGGGIGNIGELNIADTTVSKNEASSNGAGIFNSGGGTTLTDSTISGNEAGDDGGGIFNSDDISVSNSTVSGNEAGDDGGGIFNSDGNVSVANTVVSGNNASSVGGGIYNYGSSPDYELSVTDSTVSDNKAFNGGGIGNIGEASITGSTVSKNEATNDGGGIFNTGGGNATIADSTVINNVAGGNGGGIFSVDAQFSLINSTVKDNVPDNLFPEVDVGLYDAGSDSLIGLIEEGDEILASTIPDLDNLTIAISVSSSSPLFNEVESMRLDLNSGQVVKGENSDPYALFGDRDNGNNLLGGSIPLGTNRIDIDVFSGNNLQGLMLGNYTREFTIVDDLVG